MSKKKRRSYTPQQAAEDAKRDIHVGELGGHRFPSGSPFAMPYIKMRSAEAKLLQCSECGFSKGRHSRFCPKAK